MIPAPVDAAATSTFLGVWGKPPDAPAWVALGLAALLFVFAATPGGSSWCAAALAKHVPHRRADDTISTRRYLTILGFFAAFLSLGYIAYYLRGGPRIVDATSYFLQGRALSHGQLSWSILDPSASFRGRFLLFQEPDRLGGIFPPGYPLLLAAGFLIGAPMVIGPMLAAGIVALTYVLTREMALDERRRQAFDVPEPESIARFAAAISVFCVALRYHTADTMAHAACALAMLIALASAIRARRTGTTSLFAVAGLAVGYVAATRPASAVAVGLVVLWLAVQTKASRAQSLAGLALGVVPGLLLLFAANRSVAGSPFVFSQTAYYVTSDGPPGCFTYGFGKDVGCLHEHGDFVSARLSHGYGVLQAAGTTLRRLRMHVTDVVNFEPLFLLLLWPIARALKASRACRAAGLLVVLQVLAYVPFYFDGNYPGGGARLFADVLPVEHALIAFAVAHTLPKIAFPQRALGLLGLVCFGFAIHTAYAHEALAQRDGGHPMYEPDAAREKNLQFGLLFFDTDHGFNLAYDPSVTSSHGVVAVRQRNDDRDRILYDVLGHPASHAYRFHADGTAPVVESYIPPGPLADAWRFEAEAEWPPLQQRGGYAELAWAAGTGASLDRVLDVIPTGAGPGREASAEIDLPIPPKPRVPAEALGARAFSSWRVTPRVLLRGVKAKGTMRLFTVDAHGGARTEQASWEWTDDPSQPSNRTLDLPARDIPPETVRARLQITARQNKVSVDKTTVEVHR